MSAKFDKVKKYFGNGKWSAARVQAAVSCGWITAEECNEILGIVEETETADTVAAVETTAEAEETEEAETDDSEAGAEETI